MKKIELSQLIEAGAHFGHLTRRWNPKMKPYIFMEKNGIHIIDLKKTQTLLVECAEKLKDMAADGKKILFVGTKKQAKNVIDSESRRCDSYWVSERWLGGMLTNFSTIRKSIKRLNNIEKQETDGTFDKITKKERLFLTRERDKLKKVLEGIENMNRIPGAMFVVDIKKESIALKEAKRLNIPVFAIVDTNCDPDTVDFIIPANDDAVKTIELIVTYMADAVTEGYAIAKEKKSEEAAEAERKEKENETHDKEEAKDEVKVTEKKKTKKVIKKDKAETAPKTEAPKSEEKKTETVVTKAEEKKEETVTSKAEEKKADTKVEAKKEEKKPESADTENKEKE
ncbi:MAG TPA: 30S ribosomal protein S2 [Ignavibacteriaceae bacterium]|nr:30S ribosomal protein S2 [Ignavibacteriaceae bacterium]